MLKNYQKVRLFQTALVFLIIIFQYAWSQNCKVQCGAADSCIKILKPLRGEVYQEGRELLVQFAVGPQSLDIAELFLYSDSGKTKSSSLTRSPFTIAKYSTACYIRIMPYASDGRRPPQGQTEGFFTIQKANKTTCGIYFR